MNLRTLTAPCPCGYGCPVGLGCLHEEPCCEHGNDPRDCSTCLADDAPELCGPGAPITAEDLGFDPPY